MSFDPKACSVLLSIFGCVCRLPIRLYLMQSLQPVFVFGNTEQNYYEKQSWNILVMSGVFPVSRVILVVFLSYIFEDWYLVMCDLSPFFVVFAHK